MKPLREVVLAAILAVAVSAPILGGAMAWNEAWGFDGDPDVTSLSLSAQLPMYPAFGPPIPFLLES